MSIKNPTEKNCWITCSSCYRCADKGRYAQCSTCSGRFDPFHRIVPDADDRCDCRNGVLRYRTQNGRVLIAKIPGDPFAGRVVASPETADERDWNAYLKAERERRDQPKWDPISVYDQSAGRVKQ